MKPFAQALADWRRGNERSAQVAKGEGGRRKRTELGLVVVETARGSRLWIRVSFSDDCRDKSGREEDVRSGENEGRPDRKDGGEKVAEHGSEVTECKARITRTGPMTCKLLQQLTSSGREELRGER